MKATRWIVAVALGAWCVAGGTAVGLEDKPAKGDEKPAPHAAAKASGKININAASKAELMKLEGISAGVAQKIIAYRVAHGPFKRAHDLGKVEGVAKEVLEKNSARITVK